MPNDKAIAAGAPQLEIRHVHAPPLSSGAQACMFTPRCPACALESDCLLTSPSGASILAVLRVGGWMIKFGKSERLWRPLIAIVVAYAVAAQSLLIVLGGFSTLAQASPGASAFELCHHDTDAPGQPAGLPDHPCNHCISCFAGSHHATLGSSAVLLQRMDVAAIDAPWIPGGGRLPRLSAHSIASARGPPIGA